MIVLHAAILIFVALAGTAVVFTRNPLSQVIGLTFYGLLLALMFCAPSAGRVRCDAERAPFWQSSEPGDWPHVLRPIAGADVLYLPGA